MSLKEDFLSLLEKDKEFRYAVAGYLGLEEILKRLDRHEEELIKISKEIAGLREEQIKLREEQASLRREQIKMREDFNKMLEVIKNLQNTYYELRKGQKRLEEIYESFRASMLYGFSEVSKFADISFEEFVRKFLSEYLRKLKILPEEESLKKAIVDKEEINMFFENPLIVGEITSYAEDIKEIEKLIRKIEVVRKKYNKEPMKFLIILTVPNKSLAENLEKIAKENEIEIIIGKISEKYENS
ncbi:MAG: hypothetical protein QXP60_06555 [Nitrososphaerota archaeon]